MDNREPQPFRTRLDQTHPGRIEVAGHHFALVFHLFRQGEGLAAGGRTGVQHPHALTDIQCLAAELAGEVLYMEPSLAERGIGGDIAGLFQPQAGREDRFLHAGAGLFQF